MQKLLLPRLRDIFFIAILLGALLMGARMLALDSDLGRHLTLGRFILESHSIPTSDLLSLTRAGESRPPYEWLTQILFALANRILGLDGVILLCAGIIAAGFAFVYVDSTRRSQMPVAALLISFVAVASSSLHWLPRPHVVTFLFLAIWIERLERVQRGEAVPLWHFPLLMLVWVNAHGGFVFGMLAWLAYFGGWVWGRFSQRDASRKSPQHLQSRPPSASPRRCTSQMLARLESPTPTSRGWLAIGGLSLFATLLTPSGWGNWQAVLSNNSRFILSRTVETMPPDFAQAGTWPFALLLGMSVLVFLATRRTQSASHIILLGGFALLALLMARNIPLFAIAAAPILSEGTREMAGHIGRWKTIEANIAALESPLRGAVWPITLGLGLALLIGVRTQVQKEAAAHFDARLFPVAASDWLEANPQSGNMFNEINWGGYLLVRLWPAQKVFADSQTDFYGEELMREYEQAAAAREGWETVFEKYAVDWVILPEDSSLSLALQQADWQTLYRDSTTIIMRRK